MNPTSTNDMAHVYGLFEPFENGKDQCFYIGHGQGDRHVSHFRPHRIMNSQNRKKAQRIADIFASGKQPYAEKLVSGVPKSEAMQIESRMIDEVGKDKLTNKHF